MTDPWATAEQLRGRSGMEGLDGDQAAAALEAATGLLDQLTGWQYGIREDVVRPAGCGRVDVGAPSGRAVVGWGLSQPPARAVGPWPLPGPYGGMAEGCPCCGCDWGRAVSLAAPVLSVSAVKVDGAVLPEGTGWQVWDERWLLRVDGGRWPTCQNVTVPDTEVGTMSVAFTHGQDVPALGVQAALSVAAEFARWWGWVDGDCRLPTRVTQITRQGETAVVVDPMDIVREGGTGLPDADLFVSGATRPRRHGAIATPGVQPALRRRTL